MTKLYTDTSANLPLAQLREYDIAVIPFSYTVNGVAEDYNEALANLERAGWAVDCILTHCAPSSIVKKLDPGYGTDQLTDFLETVRRRCQFAWWFFGHYHRNQIVDERYILQWEQISELEF